MPDRRRQVHDSATRLTTLLTLSLLIAIVVLNLILPLLTLLWKAVDFEPFFQGFLNAFSSNTTKQALRNSFSVTLAASCIAVAIAFLFAYVVEFKIRRTRRRYFRFLAILPMLVPSFTHGIVIVYLFGRRGILTQLLGAQLPIYGPLGIILGSFFYAFPTAFLVLSQALVNLDGRYFESADILGATPWQRFRDVILPIMKYAIFSAFTVCFTMIFTDYGVPLSVGGNFPILPVLFYKNVVGLLDFSRGAIYSSMILLPAVIVYLLDIFYFSKKQIQSNQNPRPVDSGPFTWPQKLFFCLVTVSIVIPITVILFAPFIDSWPYNVSLTLRHFERLITSGVLGRLTYNSLLIALFTGLGGTVLAFFAGYIYVRDKSGFEKVKKLTHGLYMASLAIPGLALGLAFALFFKGTPLHNTMLIMIIANVIHFFGTPYMMVISHFKLLNPNLEAICQTLGGNFLNVIFDVILPNSIQMLLDVFVYFFTNAMITISAVSLLYKAGTMTLALQLTAYSDQGTWESAIAVSLVILLINTAMKFWQSHRLEKGKVEPKVDADFIP